MAKIDGPFYRYTRLRSQDASDGSSNTVFVGKQSSLLSNKTWVAICTRNVSEVISTDGGW